MFSKSGLNSLPINYISFVHFPDGWFVLAPRFLLSPLCWLYMCICQRTKNNSIIPVIGFYYSILFLYISSKFFFRIRLSHIVNTQHETRSRSIFALYIFVLELMCSSLPELNEFHTALVHDDYIVGRIKKINSISGRIFILYTIYLYICLYYNNRWMDGEWTKGINYIKRI